MPLSRFQGKAEDLPEGCLVCGKKDFIVHAPFRICAAPDCQDVILFTKMKAAERLRPWHVVEALARRYGWQEGIELGGHRALISFYLLEKLPEVSMSLVNHWAGKEQIETEVRDALQIYGTRHHMLTLKTPTDPLPLMDACVDFVIVNSPLSLEKMQVAINAALPKLKETGRLIGTGGDREDVAQILDHLPQTIVREQGGIWHFPRNPAL